MDLPVEPTINPANQSIPAQAKPGGRSLEDWNAAYTKVENYFQALRIRNKVLMGGLVIQVINRARRRAAMEPERAAIELATEEMDHVVAEWFGHVLQESSSGGGQMLSTRGRLALLLADMPGKWQDQFLRPGPWPEEFVSRMREVYLRAGPDFQLSKMTPRPLDLGPITTLTNLSRLPYAKMVAIWVLFGLLLAGLFKLIHGF
jgi:hypothetical protein